MQELFEGRDALVYGDNLNRSFSRAIKGEGLISGILTYLSDAF